MNGGGVKAPEAEVEPLKESCESLQQACNFLVVIPAGDLRQDPDKPSINKLPQLVLPNEEAVVIVLDSVVLIPLFTASFASTMPVSPPPRRRS